MKYQISVGFDVYKALTARLEYDGQTHDDIIRDLLNLDSEVSPEAPETPIQKIADALERSFGHEGFYSRGLLLPNGTKLRARYKQREYNAVISNGQWLHDDGTAHSSPSAAASAITENNVNGLRFWSARLPGETVWRRLDRLSK